MLGNGPATASALLLTVAMATQCHGETAGRVVPCPRRMNAPKPDGFLADPIWRTIAPMTGFTKVGGGAAEVHTDVRACYDDQMLYLIVTCREPNVSRIVANVKQRDGDMRRDDCVELTLGTGSGRLYHIIVSAAGGLYDAWVDPGGWTDESWDSGAMVAVQVLERAWCVEVFVPFKHMAFEPKPGKDISLHVLRYRQQTGEISTLVPAPRTSPVPPTSIVILKLADSPSGK